MKISILTIGTIIAFFAASTFFISCSGSGSNESDSTEQHDMDGHDHENMAESIFACPMHPEITGKEGEECPKCGMMLVLNETEEAAGDDHNHEN